MHHDQTNRCWNPALAMIQQPKPFIILVIHIHANKMRFVLNEVINRVRFDMKLLHSLFFSKMILLNAKMDYNLDANSFGLFNFVVFHFNFRAVYFMASILLLLLLFLFSMVSNWQIHKKYSKHFRMTCNCESCTQRETHIFVILKIISSDCWKKLVSIVLP